MDVARLSPLVAARTLSIPAEPARPRRGVGLGRTPTFVVSAGGRANGRIARTPETTLVPRASAPAP